MFYKINCKGITGKQGRIMNEGEVHPGDYFLSEEHLKEHLRDGSISLTPGPSPEERGEAQQLPSAGDLSLSLSKGEGEVAQEPGAGDLSPSLSEGEGEVTQEPGASETPTLKGDVIAVPDGAEIKGTEEASELAGTGEATQLNNDGTEPVKKKR